MTRCLSRCYCTATFLLLWLLPGAVPAEIRVTDDAGTELVLPRPAVRIVSLAPHITELLFAAGAGGVVAGASQHSDFPAAARDIPRVGDGSGLDLERILALQPDLVVAWGSGSPPGQLQQLRVLGIPVFISEPRALDDIATSLERLGRLAGFAGQGRQVAADFRDRLLRLREQHAGRPVVRVFYQVWPQPLMTVSGAHLVSDVMRLCGGRNIFDDLPVLAPQVTVEAVLQRDPEVIIAGSDAAALSRYWQRWEGISAVRDGHLYVVPEELLERHTPRILDGAGQLCERLESVRQVRGQ